MNQITKLRKETWIDKFIARYVSKYVVDDGNNTLLWNDKAPTPNEIMEFIEHSLQEAVKEERRRIVKEIENGTWPVYLRNTDLITKDRDIKIRRQMRKEIIDWLTQKPKGKKDK